MKENNKEIKERLLKARALSDEELAKVSGGKERIVSNGLCGMEVTLNDEVCPFCQQNDPCWDCQYRASWCQFPFLADDGK